MSEVLEARRLLASVVSSDLVLDVKHGQKQGVDVAFNAPVAAGGAYASLVTLVTLGATATPVPLGTPTGAGTLTHGWRTTAANGRLPRGNFDLIVGGSAFADEHLDASHHFLNGDLDRDRALDQDDLDVMVANHGRDDADVSWLDGDVNLDGFVGNADFSLMHGQFGNRVNPAPDAPTELVVDAFGHDAALAQWSTAGYAVAGQPDVDGFVAYRSADGTTFAEVGSVVYDAGQALASFADSGLTDGAKYWYRVRPYALVDHDNNPNTAPTRSLGHTGPKAWAVTTLKSPTNLAVSKTNAWEARLTWTAGSQSAAGYDVWACDPTSAGGAWAKVGRVAAEAGRTAYTYDFASADAGTFQFAVSAWVPEMETPTLVDPAGGAFALQAGGGERVAFTPPAPDPMTDAELMSFMQGTIPAPPLQTYTDLATGASMVQSDVNGSNHHAGTSNGFGTWTFKNLGTRHTEVSVSGYVAVTIYGGPIQPRPGVGSNPNVDGYTITFEGHTQYLDQNGGGFGFSNVRHSKDTAVLTVQGPKERLAMGSAGGMSWLEGFTWSAGVHSLRTHTPVIAVSVPDNVNEMPNGTGSTTGDILFTRSGDIYNSDSGIVPISATVVGEDSPGDGMAKIGEDYTLGNTNIVLKPDNLNEHRVTFTTVDDSVTEVSNAPTPTTISGKIPGEYAKLTFFPGPTALIRFAGVGNPDLSTPGGISRSVFIGEDAKLKYTPWEHTLSPGAGREPRVPEHLIQHTVWDELGRVYSRTDVIMYYVWAQRFVKESGFNDTSVSGHTWDFVVGREHGTSVTYGQSTTVGGSASLPWSNLISSLSVSGEYSHTWTTERTAGTQFTGPFVNHTGVPKGDDYNKYRVTAYALYSKLYQRNQFMDFDIDWDVVKKDDYTNEAAVGIERVRRQLFDENDAAVGPYILSGPPNNTVPPDNILAYPFKETPTSPPNYLKISNESVREQILTNPWQHSDAYLVATQAWT